MSLAHVHQALSDAYLETLTEEATQVEGLDTASCGPHMKHLAQLAAGAAADDLSADQWRTALLAQAGPSAAPALDTAEECMRQSGLWPWHSEAG